MGSSGTYHWDIKIVIKHILINIMRTQLHMRRYRCLGTPSKALGNRGDSSFSLPPNLWGHGFVSKMGGMGKKLMEFIVFSMRKCKPIWRWCEKQGTRHLTHTHSPWADLSTMVSGVLSAKSTVLSACQRGLQ